MDANDSGESCRTVLKDTMHQLLWMIFFFDYIKKLYHVSKLLKFLKKRDLSHGGVVNAIADVLKEMSE